MKDPQTAWTLTGGLRMGDPLDAVELANGRPLQLWVSGPEVAVSSDWSGGRPGDATDSGCEYVVEFGAAKPGAAGAPLKAMSDDPAVRALEPRIVRFGLRWRAA